MTTSFTATTKGQAICPYCGVGCRLLMESADGALTRVTGVADAPANLGGIGADGPPCCYADIDLSDCLVVWGSNMADAFPVTFNQIKAHLKAKPGIELIVVDPRRTNTANHATLYVPVAPSGDIPLMNAVG